jgi:hypothetical protein
MLEKFKDLLNKFQFLWFVSKFFYFFYFHGGNIKCRIVNLWIDQIREKERELKFVQKVFKLFQHQHLIDATTWIHFGTACVCSHSKRQMVLHRKLKSYDTTDIYIHIHFRIVFPLEKKISYTEHRFNPPQFYDWLIVV